MVSLTTLAIATIVIAIIYFYFNNDNTNGTATPLPGPRGLPFFGSALSIRKSLHEGLSSWVPLYGKIFSVNLFGNNFVVINDAKIGREAFNNSALTGRPHFDIFEAFSNGRHGVIFTEGQEWVEQRRFALRHLRDFGFGKNSMEELITEEVKDFTEWLKSGEGKPTRVDRSFNLAVINSLWTIMTGNRLKQNDARIRDALDLSQKGLKKVSSTPIGIFFPKIAKAFPNISGWVHLTEGVNRLLAFCRESIKEHKATFSPDFQRDFLDDYLKEIQDAKDPKSSFYGEYGTTSLESTMLDLFTAGSETTSATLTWAILYLTTFPDKLKKVQDEIDRIVGNTRLPSLSDRENLPYVEAVIFETLRMSSLVPTGVFHCSTEATKIANFDIPKDYWICLNTWHIHNDKAVWGDPENFRPERFLSEDGKTAKKSEHLVPFSVGKRACLGESLAKDEIFLFLTTILQKFSVKLDPNSKNPGLEPPGKLVLLPPTFKAIFNERNLH